MKNLVTILLLALSLHLSAQCNTNPPVVRTITQTAPGEIYRPNGSTWLGGDTLKIMLTTYPGGIEFYNVGGDVCRPLVIVANTTIGNTPFIRFKGKCNYIKLLGLGSRPNQTIETNVVAISTCSHIWVDNCEIHGSSIGIYCKTDPDYSDTTTWGAYYTMHGCKFTNNWIYDTDGEGMYIGHTSPYGVLVPKPSGGDTLIFPIVTDSVEVAYNYVNGTGWDGIQLSNARYGNSIHDNYVFNFGLLDVSGQKCGAFIGGNSNGNIFNNTVKYGTGNALEYFGYGTTYIYNNICDSVGTTTERPTGDEIFFSNDYLSTAPLTDPKQQINLFQNQFNHPQLRGAIRMTAEHNNWIAGNVYDNTFCIPNANVATWQSTYLILGVPGTINNNNVLGCLPIVPVCCIDTPHHPIRPVYNIYSYNNKVYAILEKKTSFQSIIQMVK